MVAIWRERGSVFDIDRESRSNLPDTEHTFTLFNLSGQQKKSFLFGFGVLFFFLWFWGFVLFFSLGFGVLCGRALIPHR
jgi:hypothetical protein